jgi:protein involved in polysaccharide export with SLBB domain
MIGRHPNSYQLQLLAAAILAVCGCQTIQTQPKPENQFSLDTEALSEQTPRELYKSYLPPYVIEPPDILVIDAVSLTPKMPYNLRTGDVLSLQVPGAFSDAPIQGLYPIQPGGTLDLGLPYGSVNVGGMSLERAREAITTHLKTQLREPQVVLNISQIAAMQQVQGQHLVKPDGTVRLGTYGSVLLVGMTLDQAEKTVEQHLAQYLDNPDVSLDVFAFNSKSFYVVLQGAGLGDQLIRFPVTGNETVLDAMSQVGGLSSAQSTRMWIARPGPNHIGGCKILPVDYNSIVQCGDIRTNYQILPGDRLFVSQNLFVAWDTQLGKLTAPFERMMGFSLLGVETVSRFSGKVLQNQFSNTGQGGF